MTTYEFVSVHEYTSGPRESDRFLKFGKGESEGADIAMPTPESDEDFTMARMERKRLMTWRLPHEMAKDELREYLDNEQPEPVWDVLSTDDEDEAEPEETDAA